VINLPSGPIPQHIGGRASHRQFGARILGDRNHEPASRRAESDGGAIAPELSPARLVAGVALSIAIALAARRVGALSARGSVAAIGVGIAAFATGWPWALLLLVYFLSSIALTRYHASLKAAAMSAVVAKGGPRDTTQVLANGGVFGLAGVLWLVTGWEGWRAVAAGALAAAASDTWATEIGALAKREPRSLVTWRRVPTGTSGGVSLRGLAAAVAGAAFVALTVLVIGWPRSAVVAAFAGGLAGSTIDSLLGATLQQRRWCDRCNAFTERTTHRCGAPTRMSGGVPGLDNDMVNALSTVAGGLLGLLVAR
jgi:uncharacterized protein (TIGR00297 family)